MKLLGVWHDRSECLRIGELLEERGIPTYREVSGFNTNRAALFVCINSQFQDALALLANPDHRVAQPVNVDQFRLKAQTEGMGTIIKGLLATLAVLMLIAIIVVVSYFVQRT